MSGLKTTPFLLALEARMKTADQIVKTILANALGAADRTTCLNDLVDIVNDLRYMETDILKFEDTLGSYTPALATYTTSEVLYRGQIITGLTAAAQTAELVRMTGILNTLLADCAADVAKKIVSNRGKSRAVINSTVDTDNTIMTKSGTYNTKEADVATKGAAIVALLPTLVTIL